MDLTVLHDAKYPIPLHAYAAFFSVMLGAVQFLLPKGTKNHKYIFYSWVGLMLMVSVSSFWISTIKILGPFSPIHYLSIFTIWSLFEAIRSIKQRNIKRHKRFMQLLYVLALLVTGASTMLPGRIMYQVFRG